MKHRENQVEFICKSVFLLVLAGFFIGFLLALVLSVDGDEYPPADSLTYETCTFERCERKKTSKYAYVYMIYVEEYEEPLRIGSVMDEKLNHGALERLTSGNEIVVSVSQEKEQLYLYSLSYGNVSILTYEDYVSEHTSNSTLGIALMLCLSLTMLGLFIANIICYKKKGVPLKW